MALTTTRAVALTAMACALAAAAWLPPRPQAGGSAAGDRWRALDPTQRLLSRVFWTSRQLSLARETLLFLERRDSLAAQLGGAVGVTGVSAPDLPPDWSGWVSAHTERARRADQPTSDVASVLTATFFDSLSWRVRSLRWDNWSNSTVTALGPAAAPFTCVTIHDIRRRRGPAAAATLAGPDRFPTSSALGICRFFASFGIPGPGVTTWLLDGGWYFGAADGAAHRGAFDIGHGNRDVLPYLVADAAYTLAACVEGSATACRAWFLKQNEVADMDRRVFVRLGPPGAFITSWWGGGFSGLLADLQDEMGPDRFRAFWTSPLPVDSAFATAFGAEVGAWTLDWLERRFGPLPRRGPGGGDYAVTVAFAGLLVAVAAAAGYRRQVR